ncbi:MAG TPA: kelch repeat-containing protein [Candidatus Krumholzibacteria bacterium]|nr:kelch repeat-containing protein [Candidatus Krumholzibacteria bacterium]
MSRSHATVPSVLVAVALSLVAHDARAQSWTELTPASGPAPAARRNASAIFDTAGNRMVIFGGFGTTYLNDIWAFDLDSDTWTDLTPASGSAPAPRLTPASVYDPAGHRMITWSGQGPGVFFNDVWAFDLDAGTWSQFTPAGGPPNIRYGVGYTWDPVARDLVTFAGFTNLGRFDDVWRFNGETDTWTDVSAPSPPLKRCLHAACYDPIEHRMIMYGGQNTGPLDDIWELDFDTGAWTDITPVSRPAGRYFTAFVYDAANHRATVFGGQTQIALVNEVWVFDLWNDAWTQLAPAGTPPSGRAGAAGIYDGTNDRMIVFGGNDGAVQNDVWALEGLSGTTTAVRPPVTGPAVLHPNHPNPFNPTTTIRFEAAAGQRAFLRVYDVNGAAVRTLFDGTATGGVTSLTWNGRDDDGRAVASGVYFYRLETAGVSTARRMVLLK